MQFEGFSCGMIYRNNHVFLITYGSLRRLPCYSWTRNDDATKHPFASDNLCLGNNVEIVAGKIFLEEARALSVHRWRLHKSSDNLQEEIMDFALCHRSLTLLTSRTGTVRPDSR